MKFLIVFCLFVMTELQGINVVALAGSTREESVNKKLVLEAAKIATGMKACVNVVDLKEYPMPFFDEDLEAKAGMPPNALKLQQVMADADVVFIASPEYNRSVSAVLKNTIDWLSREKGHGLKGDSFRGKRFVLLSASPSGRGGSSGLMHLRQIIEALGGKVLEEQLSLPGAYSAFDSDGNLKDPKIKAELTELVKTALT